MPVAAFNRCLAVLFICLALVACNNYGDKLSKEYLEVYYKDGITKDQAQKTLDLLYPAWKNQQGGETPKKSVQLTRTADTINFRMVIDAKKMAGIGDEVITQMANEFSTALFGGQPVNVDLTDNKFKLIRKLPFRPMPKTAGQ